MIWLLRLFDFLGYNLFQACFLFVKKWGRISTFHKSIIFISKAILLIIVYASIQKTSIEGSEFLTKSLEKLADNGISFNNY